MINENKLQLYLENDKFNISLYIDASASCSEYVPLFYDLAKSIPRDKFEISLFSFDSEVYKLDVDNPKVYGGGGTYFHIIEESIQKERVNNKKEKYPDLVFIITDGDGNNVNPEISKNWFWIMPDGSNEQYISSDSEIVYIEDIAPEYNYSSFQDNLFSYDSFDFF